MPDLIIHCPQCQRQLRVPDEFLGQLVKCPTCETAFTVSDGGLPQPAPAGPPSVIPAAGAQAPPRGEPWDIHGDDKARARSAVLWPGILLLVSALLGVMFDGFVVVSSLVTAPAAQEDLDALPAEWRPFFKQAGSPENIRRSRVLYAVGFVLSLVTVLGAVQMLRLRTWWLALAGSIVALINFPVCCCTGGLPIAVWALVVLLLPYVKPSFE